jgi:putative glutamine amidotransferase
MDSRPRIGVTCSPLRPEGYYDPYLQAIESAGGEAVVIAPLPARPGHDDAQRILSGVDGLVVPGGWDIAPEEYGGAAIEGVTEVDHPLDQTEVALVRGAVESGVPVFGICRGQQLINVALGGTLLQHIEGHDGHDHERTRLAHAVAVDPDSELGRIAPLNLMVNSLHHQAIKDLAPGLRTTAVSPDGIVEAVESPDGLVVAVQSHPEELVADQSWARDLFARFVERSARADHSATHARDDQWPYEGC